MLDASGGNTGSAEELNAKCTIVSRGSRPNQCNVLVRLRFDKHRPGNIHCDLTCSDADNESFSSFSYPNQIERIDGQLVTGEKISIKPPNFFNRIRGWEASMEVEEFTYGHLSEIPFHRGRIALKVTIPHTPVAVKWGMTQTSYKGVVKKRTRDKPISWKGANGTFVLGDFYEYETGRSVGLKSALLRIQKCQIWMEQPFSRPVVASDLISRVQTEIEEPLTLLGFLSRRPLPWYELHAMFIPEEPGPGIVSVRKRRSVLYNEPSLDPEFLVSQRALSSRGRFGRMLSRYNTSAHKEVLKAAINFSVAAYQYEFLEAQAVSLYSGVEALINGLSGTSSRRLPTPVFKDLKKEIEKTIDKYLIGKCKNNDEIDSMKRQVGDLNRKHLVNLLLRRSYDFRVPIRQLWPKGILPEEGFREIFSGRRADLLHRGIVKDWDLLSKDATRLSAFLELFILRLLGFPLRSIHPSAHASLRLQLIYEPGKNKTDK